SREVDQRLTADLNTPIKLGPQEWTSGDIVWIVDAVGDERVIGPMLQGLVQTAWQGKPGKMRARDKDGQVRVAAIAIKTAPGVTVQLPSRPPTEGDVSDRSRREREESSELSAATQDMGGSR